MTQFEIGSQWRAKLGHRAMVVKFVEDGKFMAWHDLDGGKLVQHCYDGKALRPAGNAFFNLMTPWREPESGVCWVHVTRSDYDEINTGIYRNPIYSSIPFSGDLISRIRVPWTEGQFDEPQEGNATTSKASDE